MVLLLDGDRPERAAAQKRLIESGTGAIDELSRLLLKGDEKSGITAAGVLGLIGEPAAAEPLAAALYSPSRRVRTAAAKALGRIDAPSSLPTLAEALEDRESVVREAALRSLIGKGKAAIPWLIESVRNDRPGIRNQSAAALADLTGESFGENFPEWRKWWDAKSGEDSSEGKFLR